MLTDPGERELVAGMWAFRARSENQAAARFVRLRDRLRAGGVDGRLVTMAEAAIDQERRHRARCIDLAVGFGHAPLALVEVEPPEVAPAGLSARRRLTWEVFAFCCLTESINAALLSHSYAVCEDPDSKAAVRKILADEVQHARLGWAYLGLTDDRAWLAEHLPRMLAATVPEELLDPRIQDQPSPALRAYGVFPRSELGALLASALEEVIGPGLETLGIPRAPLDAWFAEVKPSLASSPRTLD